MSELYFNRQAFVEELVGIVGMLSSRQGSTVKDITSVLESLHGPVRQDVIQESLWAAVSSGVLVCKNRRYKVNLEFDEYSKSEAGDSIYMDLSDDDSASNSFTSTQAEEYLDDLSLPASEDDSVEEILSAKSIASTGELSGHDSEELPVNSKPKQRKSKAKKPLIVRFPVPKKNSKLEKDTCPQNSEENFEEPREENSENGKEDLPAKKSMNTVMNEVMRQLSGYNQPSNSEQLGEETLQVEEPGNQEKYENIINQIMEVMKKVNAVENSGETEECHMQRVHDGEMSECAKNSSKDVTRTNVKSLGDAMNDVMKKIFGGEDEEVNDESVSTDGEPKPKTTSRSVATESESQDVSNHRITRSMKRVQQQTSSNSEKSVSQKKAKLS